MATLSTEDVSYLQRTHRAAQWAWHMEYVRTCTDEQFDAYMWGAWLRTWYDVGQACTGMLTAYVYK